METPKLNAEKIKHPFQLLAAWFVMLVILDGMMLTAAARLERPPWAAAALVITAIAQSGISMLVVFLMLTVYRHHLEVGNTYLQIISEILRLKYDKIGKTVSTSISSEEVSKNWKNYFRVMRIKSHDMRITHERVVRSTVSDRQLDTPLPASTIEVEVSRLPRAQEVLATLEKISLRARIYDFGLSKDESLEPSSHQAIWIGKRVPANKAVSAIKSVRSIWPHLIYLHISGDLRDAAPDEAHDQLFFGGSTETAKDWRLKIWSDQDFEKIFPDMSTEDFHNLIRAKYSGE